MVASRSSRSSSIHKSQMPSVGLFALVRTHVVWWTGGRYRRWSAAASIAAGMLMLTHGAELLPSPAVEMS